MWAWQALHPAFAPEESPSSMATQTTAAGMATAPLEVPQRERKLSLLLLEEGAPGQDPVVWEMDYNGSSLPGDPRRPSQRLHAWLSANEICPCELRGGAEKDLAQKVEELARSNRELEQFAQVAAHDLQEPLRMVASSTQFLAEQYRGKFDENSDKHIGYATEGALRMQVLIQDLLAFSRLEQNGVARKLVDCNHVVEEVLHNLSLAVRESDAIIHRGPLPTVWANHSHLVQVFQNLIGNAIKFRKQ